MYGQQNAFYNPNFNPYQQNMGAVPDMLNQYKGQYQPMSQMQQNMAQPMQQNFQQMAMQTPTQQNDTTKINNGFIWVQGLEGAKGYLVTPNNTVLLWDTESPTIYVKTADNNGIPSMRILDFKERNLSAPISPENVPKTHECKCGDKFVTKEQFEALQGKFETLSKRFDETAVTQVTKPVKTTKKDKGDVE